MVQLRGDLTKKMEDGAGKVRFRRWKNMTIGARISLVILIAIIVVAALADFIAPLQPPTRSSPRSARLIPRTCSAPTTRAATLCPA